MCGVSWIYPAHAVNVALGRAGADHLAAVKQRLDVLADAALADREQARR